MGPPERPLAKSLRARQDVEGQWHSVTQDVTARSEAAFTHRVCLYCTDAHRDIFLGATQ
jgi:hypothetical protein